MSRYSEYDDYEDEADQILAQGRWERNARATLKGKRGRKALADLREALLALPEHRLIEGALCAVGDVDQRVPAVTGAEIAEHQAKAAAWRAENGLGTDPDLDAYAAGCMREEREEQREAYVKLVNEQGQGVCAIGAYLWHKRVKAGADPHEAFGGLPTVLDGESGDPLGETAHLGQDAGLAYTLAWELAYRNDETFGSMTPEERYTAFLAWIDAELAEPAAA